MTPAQQYIDDMPGLLQHALEHHQMAYEGYSQKHQLLMQVTKALLDVLERHGGATGERERLQAQYDLMVTDWENENDFLLQGGDLLRQMIHYTNHIKQMNP